MRGGASLALGVCVAIALAPGSAQASDIVEDRQICTGGDECRYFPEYSNYTLVGAAGERNRVTVTETPEGEDIVFRDDGAPINGTADCSRIDAHAVRCNGFLAYVRAGDLDDVIATARSGSLAYGEDGDDELTARATPAFDYGYLVGGPGNDVLRGGPGNDYLVDGQPGTDGDSDRFEGGEGTDIVDYRDARVGVKADLSVSSFVGEPGEHDSWSSVEGAAGGPGPDDLRAGSQRGLLSGRGGDDRLLGGPGPDQIDPGSGNDVVDAGAGLDRVDRENGRGRTVIACGPDADFVGRPRPADLLRGDCERAELRNDAVLTPLVPLRSLDARVLKATIPEDCEGRPRLRIELRVARTHRRRGLPRAGTLLGRRSTRRICHRSASVRLTRPGRRMLRRHRRLPVEVRVFYADERSIYVLELVAP